MSSPWPRLGVYKLPDQQGWMVPSRSTPGAFRHVTWTHTPKLGLRFHCTCPAGVQHDYMDGQDADRSCSHTRAAAAAERADGVPPRPPARVNPSVFVD